VVQHTLVGVNVQVIEQTLPDGQLVRAIVATSPQTGDSWAIPMDVMLANRIGRALLGTALVVPFERIPGNGGAE
jgi:hypothetical protein